MLIGQKKFFETGDIRLDYAYAKHTINIPGVKKLNITIGQQKNPFKTSWLLWDSDVRPTGFTGHADLGMVFGTFGALELVRNGHDMDMMYALQGGAKFKNGNIGFTGTLTGYFINRDIDDLPNKEYAYQIIDIYGKIDVELNKMIKASPYLQLFYNMGADGEGPSKKGDGQLGGDLEPDSENMGFALGFSSKIDKASFKLSYAQVGADSCLPGLKNADFGGDLYDGVNVQGVVIAAGYKVTKHFGAELTAYLYEPLEDVSENVDDKTSMQMYHIDLKYKF
ncbi:MAG: hypothetical protein OMM_07755 [Candidatus Magnetoglobus multicellularis str. Araruama]|uniref:Uncharacterized protein n=1 Tax=Candidatus Magnetoglobus multicellularis str. Araruama TaxID=890399 RepID=A0A1V1PAS8_9BACT|nr:MAG: hypothetical protein OMM_07755 [Candidatus Magnetoglobus multicellularis str. Araruama]